jgi:hypothetical protein
MQDAVAIALEICPERMGIFVENPSACRHVVNRIGGKVAVFVSVLV